MLCWIHQWRHLQDTIHTPDYLRAKLFQKRELNLFSPKSTFLSRSGLARNPVCLCKELQSACFVRVKWQKARASQARHYKEERELDLRDGET